MPSTLAKTGATQPVLSEWKSLTLPKSAVTSFYSAAVPHEIQHEILF